MMLLAYGAGWACFPGRGGTWTPPEVPAPPPSAGALPQAVQLNSHRSYPRQREL